MKSKWQSGDKTSLLLDEQGKAAEIDVFACNNPRYCFICTHKNIYFKVQFQAISHCHFNTEGALLKNTFLYPYSQEEGEKGNQVIFSMT